MRLNDQPVEVPISDALISKLRDLFEMNDPVTLVIESGTHLGLGTTTLVAESYEMAIKRQDARFRFYSIEMIRNSFMEAQKNLSKYSEYLTVLNGMTVGFDEAIDFIKSDLFLIEHEKYPQVITDDENPVWYYVNEMYCNIVPYPLAGERLIERLIVENRDHEKILFVLDSCGGIGYLEFRKVKTFMDHREYYLFLDDIYHCKHWRSREDIEDNIDGRWEEILRTDRTLLAHRKAAK